MYDSPWSTAWPQSLASTDTAGIRSQPHQLLLEPGVNFFTLEAGLDGGGAVYNLVLTRY
jgi:hypothetical protein